MKVLHVINSLVAAGAENLVVTFANEQVKKNEVSVFTFYSEKDVFAEKLDKRINFNPHNGQNYFSPRKIFNLYKCIKKHDVIHVHLFPPFYIVAILSLFLRKKRFIYTEHNTTNSRRRKGFRWFEKIIYSRYDYVICISDGVYKSLNDWVGDSANKIIIKNVINTHFIQSITPSSREDLGYTANDVILVMIGRFQSQKDQDTIIRALTELPSQYKLVLIGEGERQKVLQELVINLQLTDRVNFLGVKKNVFKILKSCDIGIISSHWEGFGLVALEYIASGLPAIGSNNEGLKEVIGAEEALFKIGDSKELLELILRMNDTTDFREHILSIQKENLKNFDFQLALKKHQLAYTNELEPC